MEQEKDSNSGNHKDSKTVKVISCLKHGKHVKGNEHFQGQIQHMQTSQPCVLFECRMCGQQFRHEGHWKRHEALHSSRSVNSLTSKKKINPHNKSKDHNQRKRVKLSVLDGRPVAEVPLILSKSLFKKQKPRGKKSNDCTVCHKHFQCHSKLVDHLNWHRGRKPFSCPTCHKTFRRKDNLRQHQRTHFSKAHSCASCNESFRRQCDLRLHRVHTHGEKIYLKKLQHQQALMSVVNTKKKSLQGDCLCQYCGSSFKSQSAVQDHESRIHQGRDRLQCDDCNKSFAKRSNLVIHMLSHLGITPYQCSTCQESFSSSTQLRKHEQSHSGTLLHCQCQVCGRLFSNVALLKMHMHTHTGTRPFKCSDCSKTFSHPSTLRTHKRIHTGDKPYQCKHCDMAFSQKSSLTYHMNSHRGERPYSCHICGNSYTRMASLNIHLTRHTGLKRVACPLCDFTCDTPKHLRKHAAKAHKGVQVDPVKTQSTELQPRPGVLYATVHKGKIDHVDKTGKSSSLSVGKNCPDADKEYSQTLVAGDLSTYKIEDTSSARPAFVPEAHFSNNPHFSDVISSTSLATVDKSINTFLHTVEDVFLSYRMAINCHGQPQQTPPNTEALQTSNYSHDRFNPQNGSLSMSSDMVFDENTPWTVQSQLQQTLLPHTAYIDSSGDDPKAQPQFQDTIYHQPIPTSSEITKQPNFTNTDDVTVDQVEQSLARTDTDGYDISLSEVSHRQLEVDTTGMNQLCIVNKYISTEQSLPVSSQHLNSVNSDLSREDSDQVEFTKSTLIFTGLTKTFNSFQDKHKIEEQVIEENALTDIMLREDFSNGQFTGECHTEGNMLDNSLAGSRHEQSLPTYQEALNGKDWSSVELKIEKEEYDTEQAVESTGLNSALDETRVHNTRQSRRGKRKIQWTVSLERGQTEEPCVSKPKKNSSGAHKAISHGARNHSDETDVCHDIIHDDDIKIEILDACEEEVVTTEQINDGSKKSLAPCPICGVMFTMTTNIAEHMKLHNREEPSSQKKYDSDPKPKPPKLICAQCGKELSNLSSLAMHADKIHAGLRPFSCNFCSFSSLQLLDLKQHMRSQHKKKNSNIYKYQCAFCAEVFTKPTDIKAHVQSTHQTQNQGEESDKGMEGGASETSRNKDVSNSNVVNCPYKCGECGQMYRHVINLVSHMTRKHSAEKRFKCGICDTSYLAPFELGYHMLSHNGRRPCTCNECGKAFPDMCQLRKHSFIHTNRKMFKKSVASPHIVEKNGIYWRKDILKTKVSEESIDIENIKNEIVEEDGTPDQDSKGSNKRPAPCPICGRMFTMANNIAKHMKLHTGEKPYVCSECGCRFPRSDYLQSHMKKAHSGPEPLDLVCTQCGEVVGKLSQLVKHVDEVHSGLRPFCCNLCSFASLQLVNLKQHVKAWHQLKYHVANFKYQCALCSKVFTKPPDLKDHIQSSHQTQNQGGESNNDAECVANEDSAELEDQRDSSNTGVSDSDNVSRPYKCGECGQLCRTVHNLATHVTKKHSGEKRYKCGICQISLYSAHDLGHHMLSHNGQRNCICDQCGKGFPDMCQLRKHRVVHLEDKRFKCSQCGQTFKHSNTLRLHERTHSGTKPYKCKKCDAVFAQLSSLRYHEQAHLGLKPYMCQICGNSYTRAATLNTHMNHHKGLRRFKCQLCEYMCDKPYSLTKHIAKIHPGESSDKHAKRSKV